MQEMEAEILFGKLAIHYQLATKDQVRAALDIRRREGPDRTVAQILQHQGVLTEAQTARLHQVQQEYVDRQGSKAPQPASGESRPGSSAVATTGSAKVATTGSAALHDTAAPGQTPGATARSDDPSTPALGDDAAAAPGTYLIDDPDQTSMDAMLETAVNARASDVHVHAGAVVRARIAGDLRKISEHRLSAERSRNLVESVLDAEQRKRLEDTGQIDFSYSLDGVGRFRANAYRQQRGFDAVFRVIPGAPPSLEDLNLPATLERFIQFHQGMVLITGPAGCGKSSTLAALVRLINEGRRQHVITIEDPIEYLHPSKKSVINQRQVGVHTSSFPRALRAALREDPDVIVLGELRDLETISLALTAAETGHLVLGTLHTHDAIRTISRLLGVFPHNQQAQVRTMVAESLRGVISQRLVGLADGSGRLPALEILIANKAVANLIRENKTFQLRSVLQTGSKRGMCLLDNSLQALVEEGRITREEAARQAIDPGRFRSSSNGTPPSDGSGEPTSRRGPG